MIGRSPAIALRALRDRFLRREPRPAPPLVLTCYRKADCPLCDRAKAPVARALRGHGGRVVAEWVDIAGDEALRARWGERIPVILAGDTVLAEGRVSELRLRRALDAYLAASPRPGEVRRG